ncbi:MAG: ribonuclease PH [Acidobacteria bacterium]|nr:MAG: ribonuclease PH [Acidobacteriota bacterium]REJ99294.1 MAG: ribonuclease PH [Acidobacteriota bacterium]REK15986.1 MAG: ribonuclease PH [Acidobacteriota bacterium]REK43667.1 MAG: ribonuclease PH [Acidobacteriota bacterium]
MSLTRVDGRAFDEIRKTKITPNISPYAEGSALIEVGGTKVICMASVEDRVPPWMRNEGNGWVTAEYGMLPRSTHTRVRRETQKPSGRTMEIQRLIGRSLRAVVDTKLLGERQIFVDCDVIQADGGTRCASITGAYVALALACRKILNNGTIHRSPIISEVAAISVGMSEGTAISDLKYEEDSTAEVDMNIVCTGSGKFIEIQGTAEQEPFDREQMNEMLALAEKGLKELFEIQRNALA